MDHGPEFHTTRWTLVVRARDGEREVARAALGELLDAYWFPLYACARRTGLDDEGACDAVQGFAAKLLAAEQALRPDAESGRFRAYLAGALRNHLANERRARATLRRDGGRTLALTDAAERYCALPSDGTTPEEHFARAWALEVLARARRRLAEECEARGRGALLSELEETLDGSSGRRTHAERAQRLGLSEGAVKVAAHRLRSRLGEFVREDVAQTVAGREDVEAELRALAAALAAPASGNPPMAAESRDAP